jgi:hypothetical protein
MIRRSIDPGRPTTRFIEDESRKVKADIKKQRSDPSLRKLCQRCDEKFLLDFYLFLTLPVQFEYEAEIQKSKSHSVIVKRSCRLWSPDLLRYGEGKKERFTLADLRRIAATARKLQGQLQSLEKHGYLRQLADTAHKLGSRILDLRRTPLCRTLTLDRYLSDLDLLTGSLVVGPAAFEGILALPKIARRFNSCLNQHADRILRKICQHVRECWGSWQDQLVSDWLRDTRIPHVLTADALKVWRNRQGLKDQK